MFTLRDQIFPASAGNAQASRAAYEQSVGRACSATNAADRESARNARRLSKRLKVVATVMDQRNALRDNVKQLLASSRHRLSAFMGLHVPDGLVTEARATSATWSRMIARWSGYLERLDAVTNERDLLAVAKALPAMHTAAARDGVTRNAGLVKLGGGSCELDEPIVPPTISLDAPRPRANPPLGEAPSRPEVKPVGPPANAGSTTTDPNPAPTPAPGNPSYPVDPPPPSEAGGDDG
jgi:hypothetical protein